MDYETIYNGIKNFDKMVEDSIDNFANFLKTGDEKLIYGEEDKYICSNCNRCIFYKYEDGMNLCNAKGLNNNEGYYGNEVLTHISGLDCDRSKYLKNYYYRKCNNFSNKSELEEFINCKRRKLNGI